MGYTIYWKTPEGFNTGLERCASGIRQLLDFDTQDLASKPLRMATGPLLAGATGTGRPLFNGVHVELNGIGEDSNETFCLGLEDGFGFCKTANKPYDVFVKASLIIAQLGLDQKNDLKVSCDGTKMDWVEAMLLVNRVIGEIDPEDFLYTHGIH